MANPIKAVIKEEIERLKKMRASYEREIKSLPKGSFINKKIKGRLYLYLAYREGKKVRYRYVGNLQRDKLNRLKEQIKRRKRYQALLREVVKNLNQLEKAFRGKKI